MRIRRANPGDTRAVLALLKDGFDSYRAFAPDGWEPPDPGLEEELATERFLGDERVWYDFVRPGLMLYGIVPPPLAATISLRPALSLRSRIVAVKGVRPGEGTGYGLRTTVDAPRRIAVVPAGYADGLDLRLAGRGVVGVHDDPLHLDRDRHPLPVVDLQHAPGQAD